jgi:hypothetical protein
MLREAAGGKCDTKQCPTRDVGLCHKQDVTKKWSVWLILCQGRMRRSKRGCRYLRCQEKNAKPLDGSKTFPKHSFWERIRLLPRRGRACYTACMVSIILGKGVRAQRFTNFAIKAIYALRTITGSSPQSVNCFYSKVGKTLRSHKCQFWPWVRVLAVHGVWDCVLPLAKSSLLEAHGQLDTGFSSHRPHIRADEQILRILGRGHSVPTVTELIFVRAQRFTHFAIKAI